MFFLSISIYVYKKYRYKINQSGQKVETSLAQPEGWVALLLILVSVTLCKVSSRRRSGSLPKKNDNKKANDACLGKSENGPGYACLLYTCAIYNKAEQM